MLSLLTYNVCWENMQGKDSGKINGRQCIKKGKNMCLKNVLDLIKKYRKEYKLDLILLQEQVLFDKYLKHKNYTNFVSKSGKEKMISIWNKKTLICKGKYNTEFSRGRPIQILFFKIKNNQLNKNELTDNKDYSKYVCLINVHCGHDNNNNISQLLKRLKQLKFSKLKSHILKKGIIIISGDFNHDNPISLGKLNNKNIFGKRKFYNQNKLSSANSKDYKMRGIYNIDHILTTNIRSKSKVIKTDKWYSDHYPVIGLIN